MQARKWDVHISLLMSSLLLSLLFMPSSVIAAVPKKKLAEKKLSEVKREIESKKERVKKALKKEDSILSRIQDINKSISQKEAELREYDKEISRTQIMILGLSKEISAISGKLERRKKYLKNRLQALYKQQYGGYALLLFTAKDYQDLIRKSKFISLVAHHDTRVIQNYRASINDVEFKKKNLETLYAALETNKKKARTKKEALQTDLLRKDKLLITIRSKRSTYEKTIRELEKSAKELQVMIKELEKKKVPKSVVGKGFRSLKGNLPWPVRGRVVVPYGKYNDPKFNITVFKNGIEIKTQRGAKPVAPAGGRIVYADWFKGYGLLLIINHGSGYHTLYGNLSEIFHEAGDIINKGTAVGKVGMSSLLDAPTLYFEIRHKGKPVNPMRWLKRKSRARRKI